MAFTRLLFPAILAPALSSGLQDIELSTAFARVALADFSRSSGAFAGLMRCVVLPVCNELAIGAALAFDMAHKAFPAVHANAGPDERRTRASGVLTSEPGV